MKKIEDTENYIISFIRLEFQTNKIFCENIIINAPMLNLIAFRNNFLDGTQSRFKTFYVFI